MGTQLMGLFCLLVCCELSAGLAFRRCISFTRSYKAAVRTSPENTPSLPDHSKVFQKVDKDDVQGEDGLVSRTLGGNTSQNSRMDVTGVRVDMNSGPPVHTDKTRDTLGTQAASSLPWIHTLNGKHRERPGVYRRPRRAARTSPSEPGAVVEKMESLLKPSAQKQPTELPTVFPTPSPVFTFPEEDYEDTTPLGPIITRPRGPGLPNPLYPVTGESYTAYAIILVSVIIFTAGIIGNIAIMCTVCHNYYMRSVSNSLLANLALWDFLITFFCLPLMIFHQLTKDWLLGEFSCKIIPYFEVNN